MPMCGANDIEQLCEILINQISAINSAIKHNTINLDMIKCSNKQTIRSLKKLQKKLKNEPEAKPNNGLEVMPNKTEKVEPEAKPKNSKKNAADDEYEKLMKRIKKI